MTFWIKNAELLSWNVREFLILLKSFRSKHFKIKWYKNFCSCEQCGPSASCQLLPELITTDKMLVVMNNWMSESCPQ